MQLDKQLKSLERKLNKISKVDTARAYASAVNKTAQRVRTEVSREVASAKRLRVKDVRSRIYIRRANARRGFATISFYAKPVNAVNTSFSKVRKGYKVAGELRPRSFFARARNNGRHFIYQRKGKDRLPIQMVNVPIADAVNNAAIPVIKKRMSSDFYSILRQEFNARIKGYVT